MKSLVRDVMTTDVVTVEPWTPFRDIVTQLAEHRIGATPVLDPEGNVLGVVTEADLLVKQEHADLELNVPLAWNRRRRLEREKAAAVARELMTRDELLSQLRLHGIAAPAEVGCAFVAPNGLISVVRRDHMEPDEPVRPEAAS